MKQKVYAIFDSVAMSHLQPFFMPTDGLATRAFKTAVNDENTQFNKNPHDFALYYLGDFDDISGVLLPAQPTKILCTALSCLDEQDYIDQIEGGVEK